MIKEPIFCALCGRKIPEKHLTERHHPVPVAKGGKSAEVVCIDCGDQIHQLFSNNELRDRYNTMDKLKAHSDVQKWIRWVRKQKNFGICMKKKKKR
jgi:hypothetical protein